MQLTTKHFGEIEFEEDTVITFEDGLPGFREDTRYVLLANDPADLFHWLQATSDEDLAFVLMNVSQIMPDYAPQIEAELLEDLGDGKRFIYNIAVVPDDLRDMRVNLKAPIIINKTTRKGKQVLANNEEYGVRHYIFDEVQQHAADSVKDGQVAEC